MMFFNYINAKPQTTSGLSGVSVSQAGSGRPRHINSLVVRFAIVNTLAASQAAGCNLSH